MRLYEIETTTKRIVFPPTIVNELGALEVDTITPESSQGKHALVRDLSKATPGPRGSLRVPLTQEGYDYLMENALNNMFDIAEDNQNKRLATTIVNFARRVFGIFNPDIDND